MATSVFCLTNFDTYLFTMDDSTVIKVKKKNKAGPLKSSPGFLKCMRSVYLYFKEEKEKGALNIPINSFIERTAVACGVGRKTLYNYAKKGLFDEHPTLLQPKKKKRGKHNKRLANSSPNGSEDALKRDMEDSLQAKKTSSRSVLIQTDMPSYTTSQDSTRLQAPPPVKPDVQGPWATGISSRRDIEYFTKTNIWQSVYTINASDTTELTPTRMGNCQPTSSTLTDL